MATITSQPISPFEEVNYFVDRAADRLNLPDGVREMLRRTWRELGVQVPVRMDDGRIEVFNGYRVQQTAPAGPTKEACATTRWPTSTKSVPWRP